MSNKPFTDAWTGAQGRDQAEPKRNRLIELCNDWLNWEAHEREIMNLALGLVGVERLEEYRPAQPVKPIVLAGGKGTRSNMQKPKVLAPILGRPALSWVLDALAGVPNMLPPLLIVSDFCGQHEQIRSELDSSYEFEYLVETDHLGTGHAVLEAEPFLKGFSGTVLVTFGVDAVMQRKTLMRSLLIHEAVGTAAMTIPTTRKVRPYSYLLRDEKGFVVANRETRLEKAQNIEFGEENVSLYVVRSAELFPALHQARRRALDPATGRYVFGELGFPNEMVKSLRLERKLVLGICMADAAESQSLKEREDVDKIEKGLLDLAKKHGTQA